ncbi:MAG: I78 family peptidase inhibitor [Pseudomonadota bacterium]
MYRFALLSLLCLGACAPQTSPRSGGGGEPILITPARPDGPGSACQADRYQSLVGQTHDDLLKTRILGPVRVIRPNQAVTMDFIATRLNIELDSEEVVTRVYCG